MDAITAKAVPTLGARYLLAPFALLTLIALCRVAFADDARCSPSALNLNSDGLLTAFDEAQGQKTRRLKFQLIGSEPCLQNNCQLNVIYTLGSQSKLIATLDLSHRDVSYCVVSLSKDMTADASVEGLSTTPEQRQLTCPAEYLRNDFEIGLLNRSAKFASQVVTIRYLYHSTDSRTDLGTCVGSDDAYGSFRQTGWRVSLEGGSLVEIREFDMPLNKPVFPGSIDGPFVVTIFEGKRF